MQKIYLNYPTIWLTSTLSFIIMRAVPAMALALLHSLSIHVK